MKKFFIILLIINVVKVFFSCNGCDCPDHYIEFDYKKLMIKNLNNNYCRETYSESDTMKNAAVAFEITIFESDTFILYTAQNKIIPFGISQCYAISYDCECSILFKPKQKITDINIITLTQLSEEIPTGTDITNLFVGYHENNYGHCGGLYVSMGEILKNINPEMLYDEKEVSFKVFLKSQLDVSEIQFVISAELSDSRILTDTTSIITIE